MQLPAHLLALIALGTAATAIPGCADTNTPDEAPEVEVNSDRSELERRADQKAQAQPSEDGGAAVADAATVEHEPKDDSDEATEERSEPFDCPACGLG